MFDAILLIAAISGYPAPMAYFESYEETCLGWDTPTMFVEAETNGICEYFTY